ncbi:sulfate permease [Lophiostoma macrostomum CBS 122681]|uniref:Sulfate permease n=1 Tax=Lophiostoma macrostomum CBS 122681 TaxID=1314788 RepID=A0A6A6SS33_9PLEO|nr:sulfate permease [Lophiostoma macrostomum CBS 122681]
MRFKSRIQEAVSRDHTIQRAKRDGGRALRALPSASAHYVVEKVPVVYWLPKYNPRWILNDVLAGVTVGVLLIPQSLAYAKIATIPGQYGLMSSWLPNFLYFFMGTSKDMSTGPTSLIGLLTSEIVADVSKEGYSPQAIASAVAMCMGIYALVIGLFKLGFLLEFVSIPVLHGFISAAGIVIMLGQIPSLFGVDVGSGTGTIIHDLFAQIPKFDGPTVGVGFGGILLLYLMQKMGQKWGKQYKVVWYLALARSAVVLILFTGISYAVNKDINLAKDDPLWALSKVKSDGIASPKMPESTLIPKVFGRSVAPFIAAAIEHLAIAKGFSRKNNYVIDPAQEMVYLGVTNFFNSFFSSMGVGGAMSRTAVNSDTGVKSPTYGFVAGGFVILAIFELSPALFWIPKATLAAIIVTAVWHIITPPPVFYGYWKTSLVDFTASMLSFWLTLFVSSEVGIGTAVGFQLVWHILRAAFARVHRVNTLTSATSTTPFSPTSGSFTNEKSNLANGDVPSDTQLFKPSHSIIFHNAFHTKTQVFDVVQTYNSGITLSASSRDKDRNWSVSGDRRVKRLRARAGITLDPTPIRVVVLDLSMVTDIDTTGLTALRDLRGDLQKYGGAGAELRFVNVKESVREVFERFGWKLLDAGRQGSVVGDEEWEGEVSRVYPDLASAVGDWRHGGEEPDEVMVVGDEKV